MKYGLVDSMVQEKAVSLQRACELLGVSRSGYYAARKRAKLPVRVDPVVVEIRAAFAASGRAYGSRRLVTALAQQGIRIGRYKVRQLMKAHNLHPVWKRRFVPTTNSKHGLPVAPNILNRDFKPARPNNAWVADITYIQTQTGWLYLAAVLDLYSRKLVGWAMSSRMSADLVCDALKRAITQRQPAPGLIVHTDRGSQYASQPHRDLLARHGFVASMSGKGNCWDNAVMERFFRSLKQECVWQHHYANHSEAKQSITQYIVGFYNTTRLHSTLGYLSPNAYELKMAATQPISLSENT